MPYRLKGGAYVSFETHNFCSEENEWFDKKEYPGSYCPDCGRLLRTRPRTNKRIYTGGRY
tara:strand:- start:97 stop:276 length:180 start_codon:yes stop_codon:yes gene_type:complete